MNLELIGQDAAAAKVAYNQYRKLRMKSKEDDQIMRAYRQAAKGTPLIKLTEVIELGGFDKNGRPLLAVCRADLKWCEMHISGTSITFKEWYGRTSYATPPYGHTKNITVSLSERPKTLNYSQVARAMVPVIPAHLRPVHSLAGYFILWEAEWRDTAPKDPALLKHIGGDLYAVLAVWDLTEIERAVLAGRRPE